MDSKELWGCFLMSGVRMLHFLKDWWKFIQIHQYYYGFNALELQNWWNGIILREGGMRLVTKLVPFTLASKNPNLSCIRVFRWKLPRQPPLNTPKNPNRKTHLRSVIFWNSAEISLVFCQCKRSLQSRRYYSGFWSRGTWPSAESPDRGPRRNAHYTCTVKGREKSRMRTTYQNISMRFGFFRACAFRAKNPECYGFFWQCKRYNKKPRFFGFWFLPM